MKTTFFKASLLTLSLFTTVSCDDNDDPISNDDNPVTVGAFVSTNSNYSSLNAALIATGLKDITLDQSQTITVFAPDNDSFATFLSDKGFENGLSDVDTEEELALVKNILLNHVILGTEAKANTILDSAPAYIKNAAVGPKNVADKDTNLSLFYAVEDEKVMVNGDITVTTPDAFDASNGIVHAVDKVIDLPKISTFATADARISILKDKLIEVSLVTTVDDQDPATVFAPLNAGFEALESVPTGDALANVLKYHVISGANAVASDLPGLGSTTPATLQGQTVGIISSTSIKGNANTESTSFVINDIQAINGVIHVIDDVLLPSNRKQVIEAEKK
ncbi:fasciclin domain-containing protein [Wenyingzhuangia sp. IMCC45533]